MLKQLNKVFGVEDDDDRPPLNTRVEPIIRIFNASLDDDPSSPRGVVLNGRIDPESLRFLKVDNDYQRPLSERPEIFEALKAGVIVPNIDIGVRGKEFDMDGTDVLIRSPAYIIDGWQRVGNALRLLELTPGYPLRMFCSVHFGTDPVWERHRFTELNRNIKKVSSNLHLRNMRDSNEAVLTLYGLSNNTKDFALYKKVSWSQNMRRGELIAAYALARIVARLHQHLNASHSNSAAEKVAKGLLGGATAATLFIFRKNVATFFEVIEDCWGIRDIEFKSSAPQIRTGFMLSLAKLFSTHTDFWQSEDRLLFVGVEHRRKLAKFPLKDPYVNALTASGSGASIGILYDILLRHMNKGKSTHQLRSRFE